MTKTIIQTLTIFAILTTSLAAEAKPAKVKFTHIQRLDLEMAEFGGCAVLFSLKSEGAVTKADATMFLLQAVDAVFPCKEIGKNGGFWAYSLERVDDFFLVKKTLSEEGMGMLEEPQFLDDQTTLSKKLTTYSGCSSVVSLISPYTKQSVKMFDTHSSAESVCHLNKKPVSTVGSI